MREGLSFGSNIFQDVYGVMLAGMFALLVFVLPVCLIAKKVYGLAKSLRPQKTMFITLLEPFIPQLSVWNAVSARESVRLIYL